MRTIGYYEKMGMLFSDFAGTFPYMKIEESIDRFSCFGGLENKISFDFFESLEDSIVRIYMQGYTESSRFIEPGYMLEKPYRELAMAIAGSDAKILNVFKRAGLGESMGGSLIAQLEREGVLYVEESREAPIDREEKPLLPKEFRRYRIQPKIRFTKPFYRFWFSYVEPFAKELKKGRYDRALSNYRIHKERVHSLVFEQLSNALLRKVMARRNDPLLSEGSFWERRNEFDIFGISRSGRVILAECKYRGRRVCAGELVKLREKAASIGIEPDIYALFSYGGFSGELKDMESEEKLYLFDPRDFETLLK